MDTIQVYWLQTTNICYAIVKEEEIYFNLYVWK